jgi:hypothetical protein
LLKIYGWARLSGRFRPEPSTREVAVIKMSFWAATISEKPIRIGEDECDIVITQACIQNSGALPAGTVVSLLAMTEGSSWVTLARFRTTESETTPLRIVVAAGSELNLKV